MGGEQQQQQRKYIFLRERKECLVGRYMIAEVVSSIRVSIVFACPDHRVVKDMPTTKEILNVPQPPPHTREVFPFPFTCCCG